MTLSLQPASAPESFAAGLVSLRAVLAGPVRTGLRLRPAAAPRRMAPWSVAVTGDVSRDGDDVAGGRFVVLHDPDGQEGWGGQTRIVALVQAQVEAEMAADPALSDVGWSWLQEALTARGAVRTAISGTVTRTVSTRFGGLADAQDTQDASQVEVRASWTALPGPAGLELGVHLLAWCDLLCSTSGLPPEGVTALTR